jgi:hypothetical protein
MIKRGVSTYISALLLVVVTIAGGVIIYSYYAGVFGDISSAEESVILSVDSALCNDEVMVIYLRNNGAGDGVLERVYIDGEPFDEDKCTLIIGDLGTENVIHAGKVTPIIVYPNTGFLLEHTYELKIITANGQSLIQNVKSTAREVQKTYTKQTCYWPIDGSNGSTTADPPNPAYIGTITGADIVDGTAGDGIKFDGVYDRLYVSEGDALDLTTTGTLEVWVNVEVHKLHAGIIHKGEDADFGDESYSLQFWNSDGTIRLGIFSPGDYLIVDSVTKLSTNQWYHVVGTWNSTHLTVYLNGELDNIKPNTMGAATPSDGGLVIGAQLTEDYNSNLKRFGFKGILDEPAVYSTCLTNAEIRARYEALKP